MNSISIRRRILAVLLVPFLMVLAGCGKFHADFEIKDVETVNASFDIAVDEEFLQSEYSSAEDFCADAEGETTLGEDAPTVEPYEEDGQFGCKISGVLTSDDFDSSFDLTEADGEFHLAIAGDSSYEDLGAEDLGVDFKMSFTFPGAIISAPGGEIDGSTVTYTDIASIAAGIDIRAEAGGGFPGWLIVVVIVLVVGFLLLLLLAAIIFFVMRARKNRNSGSTPSGMPGGYGAGAMAAPAAPQAMPGQQGQPGQQWGQASPPAAPPAPQGQQGQQWGQASPPAAPPAQPGQQWGQASPPAAPPHQQGQPGQQGQQPWGAPPQGQQPGGQQPWDHPDQGQQPPQAPNW